MIASPAVSRSIGKGRGTIEHGMLVEPPQAQRASSNRLA